MKLVYVLSALAITFGLGTLFYIDLELSSYRRYKPSKRNELFIGYDKVDFFLDVYKYPHVLVTGSTGGGKTNIIKCMAHNLTQFANVDIYIMSVRKCDFNDFKDKFNNLKVYTGLHEIHHKFKAIHKELLKREYELTVHVKHTKKKLKYLIFDEFSFLAIDGKTDPNKDIKEQILEVVKEVARIGSALGFYLVIGTQRADSKILEGQIKANCTSQITFKQVNQVNSQIAIGHGGAETLEKYQVICLTDEERILNTPKFDVKGLVEVIGQN